MTGKGVFCEGCQVVFLFLQKLWDAGISGMLPPGFKSPITEEGAGSMRAPKGEEESWEMQSAGCDVVAVLMNLTMVLVTCTR